MPHFYIVVIPLDLLNPYRVPPPIIYKHSPESRTMLSFGLEFKSPVCYSNGPRMSLNLHHIEIFLGGATIRALPVLHYIVPPGARRNSTIGVALGLVINKTTNHTHVSIHCLALLKISLITCHIASHEYYYGKIWRLSSVKYPQQPYSALLPIGLKPANSNEKKYSCRAL